MHVAIRRWLEAKDVAVAHVRDLARRVAAVSKIVPLLTRQVVDRVWRRGLDNHRRGGKVLKDECSALRVVFERREDEPEADVIQLEARGLGDHLVTVLLDILSTVKREVGAGAHRWIDWIEAAVVLLPPHHDHVHVGIHRILELDRVPLAVDRLSVGYVHREGDPLEGPRIPIVSHLPIGPVVTAHVRRFGQMAEDQTRVVRHRHWWRGRR